MNFEVECFKKLDEFFHEENKYYNKLGLNWVIGKNFYWLELHVVNQM